MDKKPFVEYFIDRETLEFIKYDKELTGGIIGCIIGAILAFLCFY